MLKEGKLIDKIVECSEQKDQGVGYYGHLMMIAKFVNDCPLSDDYLLNEKWQKLIEVSVKDFCNKSIFPPGAELIAAKQRQIAKAGGSFLG